MRSMKSQGEAYERSWHDRSIIKHLYDGFIVGNASDRQRECFIRHHCAAVHEAMSRLTSRYPLTSIQKIKINTRYI